MLIYLGFIKFGEPIRIECKNVKRKRKCSKKALVEKNQNIIGFLKQDDKIAEKNIDENLFTPGYDQPSYNLISEFDKSFDALIDGDTNHFMNIEGLEH